MGWIMGLFDFFKNTNNQLLEKFSKNIVAISDLTVADLYTHAKIDDRGLYFEIALEYVCVFFHAIDRIAFRELPPANRDEFMNLLEKEVFLITKQHFIRKFPTHPSFISDKTFIVAMYDVFKERLPVYEDMIELSLPSDQGAAETVFWESGKFIAQKYFNNNPTIIMYNQMILGSNLLVLDNSIGGIVKQIKSYK